MNVPNVILSFALISDSTGHVHSVSPLSENRHRFQITLESNRRLWYALPVVVRSAGLRASVVMVKCECASVA